MVPCAPADARVILYLHGGGYADGFDQHASRDDLPASAELPQAKALALDYRLAPEHPFPAAVEDATAAYRWLLAEGYQPGRIVISGDSAGGGLALAAVVSDSRRWPADACRRSADFAVDATWKAPENRCVRERAKDADGRRSDNLQSSAKQYYGEHDPRIRWCRRCTRIFADCRRC